MAELAPPAKSQDIYNPWQDGGWILFSPLLAMAALYLVFAYSGLSDASIYSLVFGVIVTGHHLPGWFRAFGDQGLYQAHKSKLWVSFLAVPAILFSLAHFRLGMLSAMVTALFDLWHTAMQQHGFGRIYAAKAGDTHRRSARVDLSCALVWYVTLVVWSDTWMKGLANRFRIAGVLIFDAVEPGAWLALRSLLLAASCVLLLLYLREALLLWKTEHKVATRKHLVHAIAFSVLAYSYQDASWMRAQIVANVFHSMQYFFMVWIFSHLALQKGAVSATGWFRALFSSWRGALVFAVLVTAYGTGGYFLTSQSAFIPADPAFRENLIGAVVTASLLLHFYVDSFIWKVRTKSVQQTLSVSGEATAPAAAPSQWNGAFHALAYFGLPLLLVGAIGFYGRQTPAEQRTDSIVHEATLFPRSANAHRDAGRAHLSQKRFVEGRAELEKALALSRTSDGAAADLARLDRQEGKKEEEVAHLEAASVARPKNLMLRVQLGDALFGLKRIDEAEKAYARALQDEPEFAPGLVGMGLVARAHRYFPEAIAYFERAAQAAPDFENAYLRWAEALTAMGEVDRANEVMTQFRAAHPASVKSPTALKDN